MPDFRQKTHVGLASCQCMGLIVGLAVVYLPARAAEFRIMKFHSVRQRFAV